MIGFSAIIKKLVYLYALIHLLFSGLGFLELMALSLLSIGTEGAGMVGLGAGLMFLNVVFFAALAYAIKN